MGSRYANTDCFNGVVEFVGLSIHECIVLFPILSSLSAILNFTTSPTGGQTNIRPYWRCYFNNTNAVIYVVDSADRERMSLARKELFAIFQEEEMNGVHLLVFANKQDQRGAMSEVEVARELGLHSIRDRKWHICKAAATKGEGLTEGLDWLADTISGTDTSSSATSTSAATTASASASLPPAASSSAAGDRARDEEGKALS